MDRMEPVNRALAALENYLQDPLEGIDGEFEMSLEQLVRLHKLDVPPNPRLSTAQHERSEVRRDEGQELVKQYSEDRRKTALAAYLRQRLALHETFEEIFAHADAHDRSVGTELREVAKSL